MGADNPQKARYKSPTGKKSTFDYEDLEHSFYIKSGVFENAVGNGTYIQSNGVTGFRAPMTCIFHGKGFDKAAKYFMASLAEPGVGVLYHPVYDKEIYVKPVGDISREDRFISGAGQAFVTVQFYETSTLVSSKKDTMGSIFDELSSVTAADFEKKAVLTDSVDRESFKNRVTRMTKTMAAAMKKASGTVSKATSAIENTGDSIARGIDVLLGSPLALARQCQILAGEPRRQNDRIIDKISAYNNLAQDIFSSTIEEPNRYSKDFINQFHLDRLMAQSIIANTAMLSVNTSEYRVRSDYYSQALSLVSIMDDYQAWHDANYAAVVTDEIEISESDTGDGIAEMLDLIRSACEYLIRNADQAKTKVSIHTATESTPLDLCYELNGTNEWSTFDEFIRVNAIVGDEYFLIPKGREIVYFV
jgi:hypothetical protein